MLLLVAAAMWAVAEGLLVASSPNDSVVLLVAAAELHVATSNQETPTVVELHRAGRSMPAPATRGARELGLSRRSRRPSQLVGGSGELEPPSTGRRIWPCRRRKGDDDERTAD
jgi:hypothetical protein